LIVCGVEYHVASLAAIAQRSGLAPIKGGDSYAKKEEAAG
jgi:hypothetical protein